MYRLVIAENPSVAMSIAKVLGAAARKEGHMEGGGWLVSRCIGHLAGWTICKPSMKRICSAASIWPLRSGSRSRPRSRPG